MPTTLAPITVPQAGRYAKNAQEAGEHAPCAVCGKGVKNPEAPYLRMNTGWQAVTNEWADANPAQDQGGFPIGPDCLKRHPELRPYLNGGRA